MFTLNVEPTHLRATIDNLNLSSDEAALVLVAEGAPADPPAIAHALRGRNIVGAVVPAVIANGVTHPSGAVILPLPLVAGSRPILLPDIATTNAIPTCLLRDTPPEEPATVALLVDGLADGIGRLLRRVFDIYGNEVSYLGGGAGSGSFQSIACVFTGDGIAANAAVGALVRGRSTNAVRHGWRRLSDPIVATRTHGTIIEELNWRPAFEVYRDLVAEHTGVDVTPSNFATVAPRHPLGIHREGFEDVVRDPVAVRSDGAIATVGDVPENTVLRLLEGSPNDLVAAAEAAASATETRAGSTALLVDCVSRSGFLGGEFDREMEAVHSQLDVPAFGALTLGEIASQGTGFIEFFNKTIVVSALDPR